MSLKFSKNERQSWNELWLLVEEEEKRRVARKLQAGERQLDLVFEVWVLELLLFLWFLLHPDSVGILYLLRYVLGHYLG